MSTLKIEKMKLGILYKNSEEFKKLQNELSHLITVSNVNKREIMRKTRFSESHFYNKLKNRSFTADQLIRIFTAIIEIQNLSESK